MHRTTTIGPEDVELPGGFKLDGWEVVAGVGIVCLILAFTQEIDWLYWVGGALLTIWLIVTFLVLIGVVKPKTEEAQPTPPTIS